MKREMAEIDNLENQLKEDLDKLLKERQICKEKCDRIKANIRTNRTKFTKNVEEFGEDQELNEDPDQIEDDEVAGVKNSSARESQRQSRQSVAPSNHENGSRASQQSSQMMALQQAGASAICQGYEYHLQHTKIDYTFKDEEIAYLSQQKNLIDREISQLRQEMDEINPNVQILEVYKEKRREYLKKEKELRALEENLTKRKAESETKKSKRLDEFKDGFQQIATHVK